MVKAVHMMDNSGSTSHSIISCLGPEIFVQINRILTKFCHMKVGGSGNYDCVYTFWGLLSCSLTEFRQVQNSLCVQIGSVTARHSSAVCVSQNLRRSAEGATYIWQVGRHVGH